MSTVGHRSPLKSIMTLTFWGGSGGWSWALYFYRIPAIFTILSVPTYDGRPTLRLSVPVQGRHSITFSPCIKCNTNTNLHWYPKYTFLKSLKLPPTDPSIRYYQIHLAYSWTLWWHSNKNHFPGGMFPASGGANRPGNWLGRSLPPRFWTLLPAGQVALLPSSYTIDKLLNVSIWIMAWVKIKNYTLQRTQLLWKKME